ncbi:hypothetical protein CTA2_111 [Colletotrichum tanaceti]|nr:hypothetical protein CTA2_112 [Colletotrichum tanaceti]KAJ0167803.1 hypothetical protein CTA2_111 [Colletotrichum tanaceti]
MVPITSRNQAYPVTELDDHKKGFPTSIPASRVLSSVDIFAQLKWLTGTQQRSHQASKVFTWTNTKMSSVYRIRALGGLPIGGILSTIVLTGIGQTILNGSVQACGLNAADSVFTMDTVSQHMRLCHFFVDPLLRDSGAMNDGNDLCTAPCSKSDGPCSWTSISQKRRSGSPNYKNLILDAVVEEYSYCCVAAIFVMQKRQTRPWMYQVIER